MQTRFAAIILAGYNPNKTDPLSELTGQPHKALVEVDGRPMVWHVVRALHESQRVDRIFVSGMSAADGVQFPCEVVYLPDQGGMVDNVLFSYRHLSTLEDNERHAILTSADIPLATGDMVTWFLDACQPNDKDVYWGLVEKQVMEKTFPNSKRSYLRLVEGQFCSGDILLLPMIIDIQLELDIFQCLPGSAISAQVVKAAIRSFHLASMVETIRAEFALNNATNGSTLLTRDVGDIVSVITGKVSFMDS